MRYEYDPNKSHANKIKHGIDFEEAQALWLDKKERLNYAKLPPELQMHNNKKFVNFDKS